MGKLNYVYEKDLSLLVGMCASESCDIYITPCIYCGMPADFIDHIPPRHMRRQFIELNLSFWQEREVPACRECNSVLGCRPLLTIGERRTYVKDKLRKRYAKYLRIPNWTQEELGEFGNDLRRMIQRNMLVRDGIRERLQ